MRSNFDIAVTVSPIVMLLNMSLHKSGVARKALIRVSLVKIKRNCVTSYSRKIQYFNARQQKPKMIMEIERSLWLICLHLGEGADYEKMFSEFLDNPKLVEALESPEEENFFLLAPKTVHDSSSDEPDPISGQNSDVDNSKKGKAVAKSNKRARVSTETSPSQRRSERPAKAAPKLQCSSSPVKRSGKKSTKVGSSRPVTRQRKAVKNEPSKEEQLLQFTLKTHSLFVSSSIGRAGTQYTAHNYFPFRD